MALPATDNFNRADADPAGGNWSTWGGAGAVKILTNRLSGIASDTFGYWNPDVPNNDQYAECITPLGGSDDCGPAVRIQTGSIAGYFYNVGYGELGKFVSGTYTLLQSSGDAPSTTAVYRLEVTGTTLKYFKDAVQIGTNQTDTSHASGRVGAFVFGYVGIIDNWGGGNLGAAFRKQYFIKQAANRASTY